MSDDKEYVYVELIFEDGKEMLQLPRRTFLKIQMKALEENKPFETKFLEILREEMEQENE
jgi:hypothetical protein